MLPLKCEPLTACAGANGFGDQHDAAAGKPDGGPRQARSVVPCFTYLSRQKTEKNQDEQEEDPYDRVTPIKSLLGNHGH